MGHGPLLLYLFIFLLLFCFFGFIQYKPTYLSIDGRIFVSRHVLFDENSFPFAKSQERNVSHVSSNDVQLSSPLDTDVIELSTTHDPITSSFNITSPPLH